MLDYYYGLKSESNDSYKGFIQKIYKVKLHITNSDTHYLSTKKNS
nr:hypothetical protein [Mycoplasmopsis bovis]